MKRSASQRKPVNARLRYGVPKPFPFEAASSWISRLTLAQGCSLEEMTRFLQLDPLGDLDREILHSRRLELIQWCGLPKWAFERGELAISQFSDEQLRKTTLLTWRGRARFRYCPYCFAAGKPYLDIRWRFSEVKHCVGHCCLLEDRCWKCRASVLYPVDMAESAAGRAGHAAHRRCQKCASDLAKGRAVRVDPLRSIDVPEHRIYRMLGIWPDCLRAPVKVAAAMAATGS